MDQRECIKGVSKEDEQVICPVMFPGTYEKGGGVRKRNMLE